MKKVLLLAATWLMVLAGCQNESATDVQNQEDYVSVQVTTEVPNGFNREIGDGTQINRAVLQVYLKTADGVTEYGELAYAPVSGKTANFSLKLPKNQNFEFVLWADHVDDNTTDAIKADKHYKLENGLQAISFNSVYTGNDETRDAFYGTKEISTSSATEEPIEIVLTRPFAQLNIIASDYDIASPQATKIKITSTETNLITGFNAQTGELEIASSAFGYESGIFDGASKQMSLDYLLAPADESDLLNFTIQFINAEGEEVASRTLNNIPVRKNYRTNISGSFFSGGTTDIDVDITATINPEFDGTIDRTF